MSKDDIGQNPMGRGILVVEDSNVLNSLICTLLKREGYFVHSVDNLTSALDCVLSNNPMLMILDYYLPDGTALEFLNTLIKKQAVLPFIVLTTNNSPEVAVEMMKKGAKDYLIKNKDLEILLPQVIQRIISELIIEEEYHNAQKELYRAQGLLSDIMNNTSDLIYFKDRESRFTEVNEAMVKNFNVKSKEVVLGKTDFDFFTKEHSGEAFKDEQEIIKTGIPIINKTEKETWHDKEDTWVLSSKFPLFDSDGKIKGILGISKDITRIKKVEIELDNYRHELERTVQSRTKELQSSKEAAEAANIAKSNFLAGVSHELRTPLNAVLGYSDILLDKQQDKVHNNYISSIRESATSLLDKINKILDYVDVEANRSEVNLKQTDLSIILNELEVIFKESIEGKDWYFQTEIQDNVPKVVLIDSMQLKKVLSNIIENAIKFITKGYVRVVISASNIEPAVYGGKASYHIEIEDTGVGVEPQYIKTLFDAFSQQDEGNTKSHEGTGLGLAITNQIVKLLNGSLSVESKVGVGSKFKILLPDVEYLNKKEINSSSELVDENIYFNNCKVITFKGLIDGDTNTVNFLHTRNVEVYEVSSSQEAFDLCKRISPDVVISDYFLYKLEGKELCLKLSEILPGYKCQIIVASHQKISETELKSFVNNEIVASKPISLYDLFEILKKNIPFKVIDEKKSRLEKFKNEIQNLSEENGNKVASLLKGQVYEQWESLIKQKSISEMESFASNLSKVANNYNIITLLEFTANMKNAIDSFDIEGVDKILDQYPDYVENLKM